ncbi:MAG: transglycosylase SLT domain-containing protein [Campylobacterota bacterium]|nr:transglycosylase SLT domain-containing protein [Campylobacterota bacterium]
MKSLSLLLGIFVTLFLTTSTLYAKKLSYWEVHKMPTSIEKDYYIWRFLSQHTTSKAEARKIINQASRLNKKLKTAYRNKTGLNAKIPTIKVPGETNKNWRNRSIAHKSFKHGLSLMQQNKAKEAARHFDNARKHYVKQYDVDKSTFWLYLSTKDDSHIKALRESCHVNIYTLIAADSMKGRYPKTITKSIWKNKIYGFDVEDPIAWAKIKHKMYKGADLYELADGYASQETIGIHTYLKAKACDYKDSYFPMPYRDVMKKMTPQRQALIYAIARQESRFVPASVSRSFALGMMQFMPFLIEHIAKEKGQDMDLDDMFNPYKAIEYADYHLDYLTKYLYHPLFIAYAYNGGIGFTKRLIKNPHYFRKGPYEPYMSMEKIKNVEAREYGKKVLANYIIYINKLGVTTRLFPLLKTLTTPSKTDKFRK